MAVYTDVAVEDLAAFLADYELGELLAYKGIAEGVENSNFLVHTSRGNFILTLYERRVAARDLPFFLGLMEAQLAEIFQRVLGLHQRARRHVEPIDEAREQKAQRGAAREQRQAPALG